MARKIEAGAGWSKEFPVASDSSMVLKRPCPIFPLAQAGWKRCPTLVAASTPFVYLRGMDIRNIDQVPAFITKDGSEIRELLAYRNSVIRRQSLAEARLPSGGSTQEHYHPDTEEI